MKGRMPVCVGIALCFLFIMIIGGSYLYGMRNNIYGLEERVLGESAVLQDIIVENEYKNGRYKWQTSYELGSAEMGVKVTSKFFNHFYKKEKSDRAYNLSMRSDFSDSGVNFYTMLKNEEKMTINMSSYFEYVPMKINMGFGYFFYGNNKNVGELYKIKVPSNTRVTIEKGSPYTTNASWENSEFHAEMPNVMIGDTLYFTIREPQLMDVTKEPREPLEYEGIAGILSFDIKEISEEIEGEFIKKVFPIPVSNEGNITMIDIAAVKDDTQIILATLEDKTIYFYLYDIQKEELLTKTKALELPEGVSFPWCTIKNQGNYILVDWIYMLTDEDYESSVRMGGVYEISQDAAITPVLLHEYCGESNDFLYDTGLYAPEDMIYQNHILYYLFARTGSVADAYNAVYVMAINNDRILYLGKLTNSMQEDFTIGDLQMLRNISYENNRILESTKFRKNEE